MSEETNNSTQILDSNKIEKIAASQGVSWLAAILALIVAFYLLFIDKENYPYFIPISFVVSLIGIRFIRRQGEWNLPWLIFCIVNLVTVCISTRKSYQLANNFIQLKKGYEADKVRDSTEKISLNLDIKLLEGLNNKKDQRIERLEDRLVTLGAEVESNEKSSSLKIKSLNLELESNEKISEKKIQDIKNYAYVSTLTLFATQSYQIYEGYPIVSSMEKVFLKNGNNSFRVIISDEAKENALKAIEINPKFPFSYYALSQILLEEKNKEWVHYAILAKDILKQTTKINGCREEHFKILEKINVQLDTWNNDFIMQLSFH